MERKCQACGNIQASEDKYCSACGAPLEPPKREPPKKVNPRLMFGLFLGIFVFTAVTCAAIFAGLAAQDDTPSVKSTPRTLAPSSCPSPAEAAYLDALDGHMRSFGAQMGLLGERWLEAADNPILIFDDMWVMGRETDLEVLMLTADRMIDLSPPPSARKLDDLVETTMEMTKQVLQLQSDGVTTADMDLFIEGANMMGSVSDRARWIRVDMDVGVFCAR